MRNRNASRVLLTFVLALAVAVPFLTKTRGTAAAPDNFSGAIYTSTGDGTTVNSNMYDQKSDVYLNGGPQNCNGGGLPDGDYYFQVTNPNGDVLLSTDPASCRQLTVSGGIVAGYAIAAGACHHANGISNPANCGSMPVQLIPFNDTPNNGGEYKVELIMQTADTTIDPNDPTIIHFKQSDSKSDNFKVRETPPPPPQTAIGGVKYYDTNHNGVKDPGEVGIAGVQIKITFSDGSMATTNTDSTGTWALSFQVGAQYTACEVLPANTLYTQTGPVSGATANDLNNDLAATANANKCWVGTVTGHDTASLDFGNVICKPEITCPQDIATCNDATKCSAVVTYVAPTATDNCGGTPTVVCSPPPGSTFPKGMTQVTCTATGANPNNTATCTFKVTVNDCEAPQISCPQDKTVCNDPGKCTAAVTFAATATDNCDGTLTPSCNPASGFAFPIGTTLVTCSVRDAAGNPASCSFNVAVNDCTTGSISGKKFYDANANGLDDDNQVVAGWKVVLSGSASKTAYTNAQGVYTFGSLSVGTYTVTEVAPNGSWVASSGTPCTFTISCSNATNDFTCNFRNYCKVASGGLTLGFWSNKNGQALITAADLCYLTSLHLRNANGTDFDPVPAGSCPNLTTQLINSGKAALSNWLTGANATNMANMLSAQMTAMVLNVRHANVDGSAFDLCSGMTVNQLLAAAETSLTANANTTAAGSARTYQEGLKTCLDKLNNNGLLVKSSPCPFSSPY